MATRKKNGNLVPVTIKKHNDRKGGHPHIILGDIDDKHISVGITHDKKKGKNSPNYKLGVNPLQDGKPSYMRRQGTVAPKGEYNSPRIGKILPQDYVKAKGYGEKAKQKYLAKKNKKSRNAQHR